MVDASTDLINLLLIVETIGIIIASIVIVLEIYIHKSTVLILRRLNTYSKELDVHVRRQIGKIDEHTEKLEIHVKDLDQHSHRMEKKLEAILSENERIYKRICMPDLPLDDK